MSTPVRYPGSVLSKNSQVRAAALQAGAYAPAAQPAPATLGFFGNTVASLTSGRMHMSRIRGFVVGDVLAGYQISWSGTTSNNTSVDFHLGLYAVEVAADNTMMFRLIPDSTLIARSGTLITGTNHQHAAVGKLKKRIGVDATLPIAVGLLAVFTAGDFTVTPEVRAMRFTVTPSSAPAGSNLTTIGINGGYNTISTSLTECPIQLTNRDIAGVTVSYAVGVVTERAIGGLIDGYTSLFF